MKYLTLGVTAALATLLSGAASAGDETIAVFTKNLTNPYFQAVRVGTETAAKALGVKVIQYIPTKPDSIPEQLSQVEDVIVKKPSAIIFIPVDYKALVPAVEKINAAGIPVTNITDRSAGGNFVAFVGADDYSIGLSVADRLLKAMGGKGNVVILEGVKGSLTSTNRVRGFNDALKKYPNVKLLASQPANFQRLNALQVMENLMQSFPADRRRAGGQRSDGGRRHRGAGRRQPQGAGGRHQRQQGSGRTDQVRQAAGERRLQRLHPGLHRHRNRRAQPAQGGDAEGSHAQADRHRQEQFGALRGAGRAAHLPDAAIARRQLTAK